MAFVQPTRVPLSFQGGLQGKTDEIQQVPPSLLSLENAVFDKIGRLNKRFGYTILPKEIMGGGQLTSAFAIDNFNNELNLFDNSNIYTYIAASQNWVNRGPAISLINTNKQIVRTSAAQQLNPDVAVLRGIEVYVWEDSRGGCRYSVVDSATNSYPIADVYVAGSLTKPKTVVFNDHIYIFYTANNNLYYRVIDTDNPASISSQTNLAADGYTDFVYDLVATDNKLYCIYQSSSSATGSLKAFYLDTSNVQSSPVTVKASAAVLDSAKSSLSLSIDTTGDVWCFYSTGTTIGCKVLSSTLGSTVLADTSLITAAAPAMTALESKTTDVMQLTYEVYAASSYNTRVVTSTVSKTGTVSNIGTLRSVGLASKAFKYNNELFVQLAHESTLQSTYFQVYLSKSPFTIVGKVSAQVGGGLRTNGMLSEVTEVDTGIYLWANLVKGQFISENNTSFSLLGVNSTKLDFTNVNKFNSVTFLNNLLFVGGILQSYDGVSVVEQNFHLFPENIQTSYSTTGGALSVGQYQYVVVYAWTDKFGQVQYSTPSTPVTVTSSSNTGSVTLTVPTLRLTAKSNVVIKIYRTPVNGVLFNEVTSELAPLSNNPAVDSVTFTDVAADNQVAANQLVYTTGGVLQNSAPPSCSLISLYQDRVMLAGLEDPNLIWFSKNRVNNSNFNTIPAEFSNLLTISVPQIGGPITALGLMDDKLIIFKESAIFVLAGAGPNDTGGDQQFPPVELVSNTIGCNNPNSVVLTKDGIMFQSTKGIWLLGRGLGPPEYIGAGVDSFKDSVVTSAVVDPNDNHLIFTTSDGPALVYDYYNSQWTTWTNHQAVDGLVFDGKFTFCRSNADVYVQNRSSFIDGVREDGYQYPIKMGLTTPWLSFGQMQGYQRVFRVFILGRFKGPHSLEVEVGYDFNNSFSKVVTVDATAIAGGNQWGGEDLFGDSDVWGGEYQLYQFQVNFDRQTCTAIRLRIKDNQTSEYNEGYTLSNLAFEVGVLPGSNRLPLANKVGTRSK